MSKNNKNEAEKNMSKISALSVLFKWNRVKTASNKTPPRSRSKHACCLHNEYIYVIGGKDGNVSLKDFFRFHIGTSKWEELNYRGEKIPYFEGHSLVSHKRLLLLFGGVLNYDHTESALWIINPDLQYIRKHVPDAGSCQPCARRYHTTVVFDNVMYVYGGFVDLQGSTAEIWAYHIDDEEWELINPNQRPENTAGNRHGHTAVLYGREMWVFGGMCSLQTKSDFWKFNFHTQKWDRIKTKFGPPCLSGHSATVVKDYMIVVGGESNGVMSNDIWVFGFCTLKWTHYESSNQYPSPCKWHTVIPITARYRKGDNSVRTKSLPHLQKKNHKNTMKRPKTSPVYSSARFVRRSPDYTESMKPNRPNILSLNMTDATDLNKSSQPIEMTSFNSEGNIDRRSPFKGNGFHENSPKQKEERSPLLCNRQMSRDSVTSNGSGLGADNPCLELDSSCEKLENFSSCKNGDQNMSALYELKDFSKNKGQMTSPNNQVITRFIKNKKQNFPTSNIPGQVNLSPTNKEKYLLKKHSNYHYMTDLVVEDLEFCDNYFSNHITSSDRHVKKHSSNHDIKHSSDRDSKIKLSSDAEYVETKFNGGRVILRENSLEEKSYSMSDITQANLMQNKPLTSKSTSMFLPQTVPCRKCSLNCWVEEKENCTDDETLSPVDVDSAVMSTSRLKEISNKDRDTEKDTEQSEEQENINESVMENGPPYLLLIGGYEETKGHNISVEPITMWQCDIMVRHSDISHGEYFKSSLVV